MLAIEVEYLMGVAFAARTSDGGPDWPPQPDRLFSALVASWGARGQSPLERRALEWLEGRPAPRIQCGAAYERALVEVYVPPNDSRNLGAVPQFRKNRQPRRFPASLPHAPLVRFLWAEAPEAAVLDALDALARDTSYLGHSASLVRCRAVMVDAPSGETRAPRRCAYPGRLAELERCFNADKRPPEGAVPPAAPAAAPQAGNGAASVFGSDWIVFAATGGREPDPVAAAVAAKLLIKAVQKGYGEHRAPAWVSGHSPDGAPLTSPHLAAVPLLDAGWRWSQGRLMGMALVLPRGLELASRRARDPMAPSVAPGDAAALADEEDLFRALGRIRVADRPGVTLRLHAPDVGLDWEMRHEPSPAKASLRPERYARPSHLWGSVTPIALDRHPKADGDLGAIIRDACARIGLPEPVEVVPGKHSAFTGTAPARARAGAPDWTRWRQPGALKGRPLTHAVIRFAEAVAGPVMLGAGRFAGLGLCLPLDHGDRS